MTSANYYLRVEAVNLENFVYDTNNLGVIRGGGLMLLELPKIVEKRLRKCLESGPPIKSFETISRGASWGMFSLELKDKAQDTVPRDLCDLLREELKNNYEATLDDKSILVIKRNRDGNNRNNIINSYSKLLPASYKEVKFPARHATVMVEVSGPYERGTRAFAEIREKLLALVRWRQMTSPSIAFPRMQDEPVMVDEKEKRVCELDLFRPAAEESLHKIKDRKRAVSHSSHARYRYGVYGKSDQWYQEVTGLEDLPLFTHHFHELADDLQAGQEELSILEGKMAVIYLDGNHFGKILRKTCNTLEDQKRFDEYLRKKQAEALRIILQEIVEQDFRDRKPDSFGPWINPACWFMDAKENEKEKETTPKVRLETLLWGGDELIWVAPAWRGWWLLGKFFEIVQGISQGTKRWKFNGEDLTFSAGLVFCHNAAPIYRIKDAAYQLAEEAKRASGRAENMAAYQVLESYDLAGPDFEKFRRKRLPPMLDLKDMAIKGAGMLELARKFPILKRQIPRRQLYRLVQRILAGEDAKEVKSGLEGGLSEKSRKRLETIKRCCKSADAVWFHLLELWDYLVLPEQEFSAEEPDAARGTGSDKPGEDI